jgi:hypothetical protein
MLAGFVALAAIWGVCFLVSSPEAKRNARVLELVHPACEHSRLSHVALDHLVRLTRDAAINQNHAVEMVVTYCLASR